MFVAELKGKIPSELQNYEDILTSSVIGVFQYLSSPLYIQSVLESCVNVNGTHLTFNSPFKECSYIFWPKLESSEPDVLLHVRDENNMEYLICIEAKYWSDKSSSEDQSIDIKDRTNRQRDQLAREIEDIHKDSCLCFLNINKNKLNNIILIYLTNHTYLPSQEILESVQYVQGVSFPKDQLYWLSWRDFHNRINKIKEFQTRQDSKLLYDLKRLLERKGLQSFNGFQHQVKFSAQINFTYSTTLDSYSWNKLKDVKKLKWNYGGNLNG
ncbi:hypothetical protein [Peribacillus sp. Hz7]|uniref:hypothetical protein n=1 Tax=Peribacillus sp. Hz7 TaxID=3344873 RepID=UPI0035CC19C4